MKVVSLETPMAATTVAMMEMPMAARLEMPKVEWRGDLKEVRKVDL